MSEIRELFARMLAGETGQNFLDLPSKPTAAAALPVAEPKPDPQAVRDVEALLGRLDPSDAAAIRDDPPALARFVKRVENRRALEAERSEQREALNAADAAEAVEQERRRLAKLGDTVARAEQGRGT